MENVDNKKKSPKSNVIFTIIFFIIALIVTILFAYI